MTHARIRLVPGYIPGPFNHPSFSHKIEFLIFLTQGPPSNWDFVFCFSTACPQFSSRFASIFLELTGATNPVFHEESGHVIKISHRPLQSGEIMA